MRAGRLDRSITIQGFTNTVDAVGTPVKTWADLGTVHAQLIQASTEEFIRGFGASDENIVIFRTRWISGLTNAHRVIYEGRLHNLKEIKEIGRRKAMELRTVSLGEPAPTPPPPEEEGEGEGEE